MRLSPFFVSIGKFYDYFGKFYDYFGKFYDTTFLILSNPSNTCFGMIFA